MKLSILIPAYNEEKTIADVLDKVLAQNYANWEKEIIVINDASRDTTAEKIQPFLNQIKYLRHDYNQGKGAAIKTGLKEAAGEAIVIQDADLEYNPADIQKLLDKFDPNNTPAIYGSRNLGLANTGYSHYVLGAKILTSLVNLFFGQKMTDVYTCYKLIRTDLFRDLNIQSRGFEIEMEITAKILKKKLPITEVAIHYYPRKFSEGKKIRFQDGLKGIWTLLKIKFP